MTAATGDAKHHVSFTLAQDTTTTTASVSSPEGGAGEIPADCMSCRLVGGGGCLGAAGYLVYITRPQPLPTRGVSLLAATGIASIGVARLLGYSSKSRHTR
ncbi:hypothetical protein FHG87_000459 [Trinorchestia longiramus]|nr:hypothetical protein FHG87_000459 [Trinorchestia longiramus]